MTTQSANISIKGHVLIKDKSSGEVLLDKNNAVHNRNMAAAIARGLSNEPPASGTVPATFQIFKIKLGNGGSIVDAFNSITFQPPNVIGTSADLYNATYEEIVDDAETSVPLENSVTYQQSPAPDETAIVIVTATIAAGEPVGQDLTDSPGNPNPEAQFAFDELGLFTYDDLMLTHIVFSPILKTANRELVITYTLTISVS